MYTAPTTYITLKDNLSVKNTEFLHTHFSDAELVRDP